ncbi:phage terminase small subunit-related protein [Bernardetia sp. Wsw4-3y2]|uniref:phage terminase small subunit-related protein n=1 Tax=Bernardetia sp. Wsw4-3y2 TaxID=3127471 RepID=UPI0030D0549F
MARNSKRELGYDMFKKGTTSKEIADLLSVTETTVSNWKKAENWKERSLAEKTQDTKILAKVRFHLSKELENEILNTVEVKRLSSIIKDLTKDEIEASKVITILSRFMKFCQDNGKTETAKGIAEIAPNFINSVLEREL